MKRRSIVALGAAAGLAVAGAAAARVAVGRERKRPDPAADDDFESDLPGATHHAINTDDGGRIHVVECGAGDPPILFVHGLALGGAVWRYQMDDLRHRHRVLAMDHRGHGLSQPGSSAHGIDRLALDLAAVLRDLDVRDVVLVGHSMGGMTTLQLAADDPDLLHERVRAIVLVATTCGPVNPVAAWQGVVRAVTPRTGALMKIGNRLPGGLLPANDFGYLITRMGFGSTPSPTHVELTRLLNAQGVASTVPDLLASIVDFDLTKRLGELRMPVTVVVGTRDLLLPPRHGRRIARLIPHSRLVELDGCGHMAMLERRDEITKVIEETAAQSPAHAATPEPTS